MGKTSQKVAKGRACRNCKCTQERACAMRDGSPCFWVELDLCSACAEPEVDQMLLKGLVHGAQFNFGKRLAEAAAIRKSQPQRYRYTLIFADVALAKIAVGAGPCTAMIIEARRKAIGGRLA